MEQDFGPRRLHAFEGDASIPKTSYRLYQHHRAVGMAKRIGGGYFFSKDGGFAWTGHEIKADTWALASCLRDHKNRVLHSGDLVIEKGSSRPRRAVVVVDDQRETWLYQPKARQLEKIDAFACRPRWSKLTLVESSAGVAKEMRAQIDHALRTLHLARPWRGTDVVAFVFVLMISGFTTAWASWLIDGQVGFVLPLLTSFLAGWGLHRWQIMKHERFLSRSAMVALSHRVALLCGTLASVLLFAFGLLGPSLEQTASTPIGVGLRVFVVAWVASVFVCGVVCLLSGDLATWQCGGFPGEGLMKQKGQQ